MANALAYYNMATITDVKSFTEQTPGATFATLHFPEAVFLVVSDPSMNEL